MAPSLLRSVSCASALGASAVALTVPQESRRPKPWPADLERWAHGPLFSENSSLYRASVKSVAGDYNLTFAAFDPWQDQGVSGQLTSGAGWETTHIANLCEQFMKNGEIGNFLDVGANIGTFTIQLADCLRPHGGRVIAVEGMPPIADHLAVGLLANNLQNVDIYNYAVGAPDDPKKVTMSLNPINKGGSAVKENKPFTEMDDEQLQDLFHPNKKHQKYERKVTVEEYEVPLTTGDLMLQYNPAMKAIQIAKVDIEGHEGHFLKGSQNLFSRYPPCILTIELIPEWLERAGTPVEGILDMLVGWDYTHVPSADHLRAGGPQTNTKTIWQKNLTACLDRVAKYDAETVKPNTNLWRQLAGEARARELDDMLVRLPSTDAPLTTDAPSTEVSLQDAPPPSERLQVASPSPTPSPATAAATGDPHLQNIHGEKFDLMAPGIHVLINIPLGERAENALLRVQAVASHLSSQCEDIYFTELNVTGSWASAQQVGGYKFASGSVSREAATWIAVGSVELKVVHAHTATGTHYLNFYIKHLGRVGFAVGGLLGEDDHEDVSTPTVTCQKRMSLALSRPHSSAASTASTAEGTLA